MKDFKNMTWEEIDVEIKARITEKLRHWTNDDKVKTNEAMKGIFDLPIERAVYQARKWAFLEARASVVKLETEFERNEWFDRNISTLDFMMDEMGKNKYEDEI